MIIAGPTAVGKTAAGIELAGQLGTEIISADSRQVFRETNIGTAVPTREELEAVPHHFIREVSITEPYNAFKYEQQVLERLGGLFRTRQLVLMVGGSGLYIDAVCQGIDDLPPADPVLREKLHRRLEAEGLTALLAELRQRDPVSWERVDRQNPLRVLKALEVTMQTGKPYSSFLSSTPRKRPFRILRIALDRERSELYERINSRVGRMMDQGLLDEVRKLQPYRSFTAMKTVGYRELFSYLDGSLSLDEAVDLIRRNTRKYARKQLTWFRKGERYRWFHPGKTGDMLEWIRDRLEK